MLSFLLPAIMSFLARGAGGGVGAAWLVQTVGTRFGSFWGSAASRLPEALWAIIIGTIAGMYFGAWWYGALAIAWSYVWMETGHGNAFHMGTHQYDYPPRHQTLDYVILPICRLFGIENRSPAYCWLFMGLKGALIGAPLGWFGLPLAVLWPLAYYISFKKVDSSEWAEFISGAFLGIALEAFYLSLIF